MKRTLRTRAFPLFLLRERRSHAAGSVEHGEQAALDAVAGRGEGRRAVDGLALPPAKFGVDLSQALAEPIAFGGGATQRHLGFRVHSLAAIAFPFPPRDLGLKRPEPRLHRLGFVLRVLGLAPRRDPLRLALPHFVFEVPRLGIQQFERFVESFDEVPLGHDSLVNVAGFAREHADLGVHGVDHAVEFVRLASQTDEFPLGRGDLASQGVELFAEVAEFALPRNEAAFTRGRADSQGAVRFEQFSGPRDVSEVGELGREAARRLERVDEPDRAEQLFGKPGQVFAFATDETRERIGSRDRGRVRVQRNQPDAAGDVSDGRGDGVDRGRILHHESLGGVAESQFHERGHLAWNRQEIRHEADDVRKRGLRRAAFLEHVPNAGAEALLRFLQAFEHLDAAPQPALANATILEIVLQFFLRSAERFPRLEQLLQAGAGRPEPRLQIRVRLREFDQSGFERLALGGLVPDLAELPRVLLLKPFDLRLRAGRERARVRGPRHEFELPIAVGLGPAVEFGGASRDLGERGRGLVRGVSNRIHLGFSLAGVRSRFRGVGFERLHAVADVGAFAADAVQFRLVLRGGVSLMLDGRLEARDLLPRFGQLRFLVAKRVLGLTRVPIEFLGAAFERMRAAVHGFEFGAKLGQHAFLGFERDPEFPVFAGAEPDTKFLQTIGVFLVPLGLRGLEAERAELGVQRFEAIVGTREVLLHGVELAEGFELLGLEAGDACGFVEDFAAVLGRSLKEFVHAALGDDGVSARAGAAAQQDILDVLQAGHLAVDEVLAGAVAVDAAADLDFFRVHGEEAAGVVEHDGGLGHAKALEGRRTIEDDVRHFAAAERLGGLLAEQPADRVHDVAFAGAVGPDNAGDPGREVETRFVGERLEPDEFEPFQHRAAP